MREATGVFNVSYDNGSFEAEGPAESSPAFERGLFCSYLNWRVLASVVLLGLTITVAALGRRALHRH